MRDEDDPDSWTSIPAEELPEVLDTVLWNMSHPGMPYVEATRAELQRRPDSASEGVQRAVAVCDEYLAPEGSEDALRASQRAWGDNPALVAPSGQPDGSDWGETDPDLPPKSH